MLKNKTKLYLQIFIKYTTNSVYSLEGQYKKNEFKTIISYTHKCRFCF